PTVEGTGTHNPIVARRQCRLWWYGALATRFSWPPPVWGIPLIQKDTGPKGLAAQPLGASPPRQRENVPASAAKFVICDHTIEEGFRDAKRLLGFAQARIAELLAWARMFAVVAAALLLLTQLGTALLRHPQRHVWLRLVRSRRRARSEVSVVAVVCHL